MKKVLILKGSPRENGNTNILADAFAEGVKAAGGEVQVFECYGANINPCHGDGCCREKGHCGVADDMVKVRDLLGWADVLCIATPIYWGGYPAPLKLVIDRFYQFCSEKGRPLVSVTDSYLLAAAANPGKNAFDCVKIAYSQFNTIMGFKCGGMALAYGVDSEGQIEGTPDVIKEATRLGYMTQQ